jgi:hypothetical protein
MNTRLIAAGLLAGTALLCQAEEAPTSQWKPVEWPLFYLVQNGYRIVAVTSGGNSAESFYMLQKDNSVFKCPEPRMGELRSKLAATAFDCFELVTPYAGGQAR